jgi:hypothetical protein
VLNPRIDLGLPPVKSEFKLLLNRAPIVNFPRIALPEKRVCTPIVRPSRCLASMVALFAVTIFTGSALLFLVQPLFARMLLPLLGGSPSVWNTAMVFYQAALLAGYAYAHHSTARLGTRRQAIVQLLVLALPLAVLPLAIPPGWTPPTHANPIPWTLALMTAAVGLPFFAVATMSPLLQRWFTATGHPRAADPYFLWRTPDEERSPVWTDRYSSVLSVFRW